MDIIRLMRYCSQHGWCLWPGTYLVPGHLQLPCWHRLVGACRGCPIWWWLTDLSQHWIICLHFIARNTTLTHSGLVTPHGVLDLINIGSGSPLSPDDTKPLREPIINENFWHTREDNAVGNYNQDFDSWNSFKPYYTFQITATSLRG